VGSIWNVFK